MAAQLNAAGDEQGTPTIVTPDMDGTAAVPARRRQ